MSKTAVFILVLSATVGFAAPEKCVQIYYDRMPRESPEYTYGRLHALFVQNLLGHFPHIQQIVIPIEQYEPNQLNRCAASIYLGTYCDNYLPREFLKDFVSTTNNVLWAGYNIWELSQEQLMSLWGVRYQGLAKLDWEHLDPQKNPGFYRYYDYKGETFTKYGALDATKPQTYYAAYEITLFDGAEPASPGVLSWARHSTQDKKTPYVLKGRNHWYFGDSPFSYVSLEDRYLIFADVLFDVLGEPPLYPGKRPALVRFEDVHPQLPLQQTKTLVDAATKIKIPFSIALIPIFADPYLQIVKDPAQKWVPLNERPEFVALLKESQKNGGSILYHGDTHQLDAVKNPTGVSAFDFEFWDSEKKQPLPQDSPSFVLDRVEKGFSLMKSVGIKPAAWITPHYAASPADNVMFGQLFLWTAGRVIYYPNQWTQKVQLPVVLTMDLFGTTANGQRLRYFSDLRVDYNPANNPGSQYFPYEIYGDVFGQRILPENVGYLSLRDAKDSTTESVDDLIKILKRNLVIRDAWGSFFIHPVVVGNNPGSFNSGEFERLFQAATSLNYEFINVATWGQKHLKQKRPAPIEVMIPSAPTATSGWNPIARLLFNFIKEAPPVGARWMPFETPHQPTQWKNPPGSTAAK